MQCYIHKKIQKYTPPDCFFCSEILLLGLGATEFGPAGQYYMTYHFHLEIKFILFQGKVGQCLQNILEI